MTIAQKARKLLQTKDSKNILSTLVFFVLSPLFTIVSTPLLLKDLGPELYGTWILLNSFITILGVTNMGVGNSVVKFGSAYVSSGNDKLLNETIRFTFALTLIIGAITTVLVLAFGGFFTSLFLSTDIAPENVLAFKLVGIVVAIKIMSSVFSAVIMAYQRYDIVNNISIVTNLSTIALSIVLVELGYGLVGLTYMLVVTAVLNGLLSYYYAKRLYRGLSILPGFSRNVMKEVVGYGMYSWLQVIVSTIYTQVDKIIISAFLGPVALGYYSVCMQLAMKLYEIPSSVAGYLFPKFSAIQASGTKEQLQKVYFMSANLIIISVCSLGLPIYLFAHDILALWIDETFASHSTELLQLLVLAIASSGIGIIPYYFLNGTGYVKINTYFSMLLSGSVLLCSLVFIPWLGIDGVAIGKMLSFPVGILSQAYILTKVFQMGWGKLYAQVAGLAGLFLLAFVWNAVVSLPMIHNVYALLTYLAVTGVIVLGGMTAMYFYNSRGALGLKRRDAAQ